MSKCLEISENDLHLKKWRITIQIPKFKEKTAIPKKWYKSQKSKFLLNEPEQNSL